MESSRGILESLKLVLKSRGMTYGGLAGQLGVSEVSVKRILTGRVPLTITRLDEICKILDIDFLTLAGMGTGSANALPIHFDREQEEQLAGDTRLLVCFRAMARGYSVEEIIEHYRFSRNQLDKLVDRLAQLRLIEVSPSGSVDFLVSRFADGRRRGPLAKLLETEVKDGFLDSDFNDRLEKLNTVCGRLSVRSVNELQRKLDDLELEIRDHAKVDSTLRDAETTSVTCVLGLRAWLPTYVRRHQRKSGK